MILTFQNICHEYLTALRAARQHALATDEQSLRTTLHNFLTALAVHSSYPVTFVGEPKKLAVGRPDFTVTSHDLPIGYIEAEAYAVNLDKLTGHAKEQNDRFRANLDNFLLTDHLEFRLYVGGDLKNKARLPEPPESGSITVTSQEAEELETVFAQFFQGQLPALHSPKDLAVHLARRTRQICAAVLYVLNDPAATHSDLHEQFEAFKEVLLPDLTVAQFAGLYAQTITYGLFAARCMPSTGAPFTRLSAATLIPKTNPFLRKLFQRLAALDLDERMAWIADDTARLLAMAPMADILAEFGKHRGKEDAVVHFYETFLAAYDPKVREVRGVYYTPEPVVAYIVRSLDHLLKTRFNKPLGLADEHTLILDPATGTGSFLFSVVRQVYDTICQTHGVGAWHDYVAAKLLPRLFGFELLIAPYAVAHLKLGLQLQELGYAFSSDQRLGIYLTNTLDEALKKSEMLLGKYLSEEANEAAKIKKERPILIVLGNPPYSGNSANASEHVRFIPPGQTYQTTSASGQNVTRKAGSKGVQLRTKTFIGQLIEDYKQMDGRPLGEKNPKWLQDDYVKFIRFAQWRIARTGEGLIGYVTNHGYLDNPTFRGMRQSLMQTFNDIYVYNLHGNSRKKETAPDGGNDGNVFDIQQGVAILLASKEKGNTQPARVHYADLWYSREQKNTVLAETNMGNTFWKELQPCSPAYLFIPQNQELKTEYEEGWLIINAFQVYSSTVTTARNDFSMAFEQQTLLTRLSDLKNPLLSDEVVREKYRLKDVSYWKLADARKQLAEITDIETIIKPYCYRPFDFRFVIYHKSVCERLRGEVMQYMIRNNLAFLTHRPQSPNDFTHAYCTTMIGDQCVAANKTEGGGNSFQFPLYRYSVPEDGLYKGQVTQEPNFASAFLKAFAEKLHLPQARSYNLPQGITPEDIFHYAYAVFHSPTYRARYAEFLKIDFPRLPLTSDLDLFHDLSSLGRQLVALHLLDAAAAPLLTAPTSPFPVAGENVVEKVRYAEEQQQVFINKAQYFEHVPPEVWDFQVGGYQVCDKWLKDRKGRKLTFDDIQHYQRIVIALTETITLMEAIDERIPGWPLS